MAEPHEIELIFVEPIYLELDVEPVYHIGTAQSGPQGPPGEPFSGTLSDASETEKGLIMLATPEEVLTGVNSDKAVVPSTLQAVMDIGDVYLVFENSLI